jgi:2-polyprenyl-6-methoxyphenol hydroxylase-like FAD-dependent oxidoreductase
MPLRTMRPHEANNFLHAGSVVGVALFAGPVTKDGAGVRVAVLGGGPAGLYFASMWKGRHPRDDVHTFEQNPDDATWGFGVVFSDRALEFLREDDPETVDLISPRVETWRDITLTHRGQSVAIDGVGFSAIGRLDLLQMLQQRARAAGVNCQFDRTVSSMDELVGYDLIVAADGVNSLVRRTFEREFGSSLSYLSNKFIWYGTTKRFETLTQTFVESEFGTFNAHHYRYSPTMSTFIVECDPLTWSRAGFDAKTQDETRRFCEHTFAGTLDGHPLSSNHSFWRNFPWIWNDRWSFHNMVLVGDALRTAHYSIGSGTRLALEDALALTKALEADPGDLPTALMGYEATRRPIVEKLVGASKTSALWYEQFGEHMRLAPTDLAMSYICRSGRIDEAHLRAMAPKFMAIYDNRRISDA